MGIFDSYLANRSLYYTILLAELIPNGYTWAADIVLPIFLCAEDAKIRTILSNKDFQKLKSSRSIEMHKNFVLSLCSDKAFFGMTEDELLALDIRQDAIRLIEELSKDITCADPLLTLVRFQKEKGCLSALLALLLYSQGKNDSRTASMLGKALKNGELDAGVVWLALTDAADRAAIYQQMSAKLTELCLYPELSNILCKTYGVENIAESHDSQIKKISGEKI